jgi:hypothetical protein
MKNVYLLLTGLLLVSVSSCKKSSVSGNDTGKDRDHRLKQPLPELMFLQEMQMGLRLLIPANR